MNVHLVNDSHCLYKFLVLMTTYNGAKWVREQLDSILAQENVNISVMICDDFSKDETLSLIRDLYSDDARIQIYTAKEQSGSAGANFRRLYLGANLDGFDYVALADQDDIWHPRKLIAAVTAMRESDAEGYSASVEAFWATGSTKLLSQCPSQSSADFLFEGAGQGCTFVTTTKLFRRVQLLCEKSPTAAAALHYHDWLIYLLARGWNCKWYFDANPCMRYRQHDGNEIGARGSFGAIARRLGMIRNGWYARQVKAAINLYKLTGAHDSIPLRIESLMNSEPSVFRNLKLMLTFFKHGRRSFVDRSVLSVAALVGWF
jgi:rhamnosyltransferase